MKLATKRVEAEVTRPKAFIRKAKPGPGCQSAEPLAGGTPHGDLGALSGSIWRDPATLND